MGRKEFPGVFCFCQLMTVFECLRATVRLGKGGLQRGVEGFAFLEEYCKWRPALDVVVLEFSFNCGTIVNQTCLEYNILIFLQCQMYPHLVRINDFFLCSLSQYIFSHVHKCFCVSGLGIPARARGNFMHNSILRHTFTQFAIRWAGMWNLSRRGTCKRRAAWQKTLYIR